MERLTNSGTREAKNDVTIREILNKLAEYEDIGLSPEQIKEVDRLYAEKCKELTELQKGYLSGLELAQIWAELEKLKEYRHLEEQGKLLKLTCAVGDTVYVILPHDSHLTIAQINKIEVKRTIYGKICYFIEPVSYRGHLYRYFENDFGKTVFLTREEAEAALKGLEEK